MLSLCLCGISSGKIGGAACWSYALVVVMRRLCNGLVHNLILYTILN